MKQFFQVGKNKPLNFDKDRCAKLEYNNYCVSGIMSRCSAGTVWEEQKKCKFSKKSSIAERCMHYIIALDGHCDCVDAQREISKLAMLEEDRV
jgi:hypothetical protein